jgi:putative FmdB family regulatory protein
MPTYEYVCTACGGDWEEIQKISEPPVEVCPKCGKSTAKRQISGGNFILKGGGWYADLYSSSSGKKDSGKKDGGGETKSEPAKTDSPKSDTPKTESSTKPAAA